MSWFSSDADADFQFITSGATTSISGSRTACTLTSPSFPPLKSGAPSGAASSPSIATSIIPPTTTMRPSSSMSVEVCPLRARSGASCGATASGPRSAMARLARSDPCLSSGNRISPHSSSSSSSGKGPSASSARRIAACRAPKSLSCTPSQSDPPRSACHEKLTGKLASR